MEKQWYVVNTYSGHENKVKEKLEMKAESMDMKDYIFRVVIPEEKVVEVKEVRLSPNIDVNDLNTKCNAARKFIEKGNKVKVSLRFRGREMAHVDTTKHILEDFAEKLSDVAVIEKAPKMEGRSMMMFLTEKR